MRWLRETLPRGAGLLAVLVVALGLSTLLVWLLETSLQIPDASATYLLAVTAVAVLLGTVAAMATAFLGFLLYNFLFTHPVFTLVVADTGQLLNLVLLLVVGIVVGQLAGAQRSRAEIAELREREARVLFEVSRALAMRESSATALDAILNVLVEHARLTRAWIGLGDSPGSERIVADSLQDQQHPAIATHSTLQRRPGEEPARWMRLRPPGPAGRTPDAAADLVLRVAIEARRQTLGSLWATRAREVGMPRRHETRMLANAADQVGQAIEQDRLRAEATDAELLRRSEAIKSALLDSVSHDLRTPLAAIRASAGTLLDPGPGSTVEDQRASAAAIDAEAQRLGRFVGNLLELSRLEAGDLRAHLEPFEPDDLILSTVNRYRQLTRSPLDLNLPHGLPYVAVDATLFDHVLTNLLENAARHASGAPVRLSAGARDGQVVFTVEDGGPGVPDTSLGRIFDKFYRGGESGRGSGIGLAVVRGLTEAMGGRVDARRSDLGGLAVEIALPQAQDLPAGQG